MTAPGRLRAALADRYRIERELGAGGMATVYLAEDLKHNRKVAIKVLKPELAAVLGAERFVQEIKTTAALSHPHILPLFDSGEAGGFLYYVMPYLEGETVREKLNRETQLGIEEAVRITTEVADALDYAHRHGVIHRDMKPENILLHDGRAMVMDFGIALALSAAAGGRMTETGMSLGTPHYMSPEQATADRDITARSDIYSLGSVLYEMLTGEPPHMGTSAQQIIMKIVTEEAAPVTKLRKSVPPNVAATVAKALEKLPADRFESAKAFAEALANPAFRGDGDPAVGAAPGRPARSYLTIGLVLAAGLAAGIGADRLLSHDAAAAPPVIAATITADSSYRASNVCCGPSLAMSRDGRMVAFYAEGPGESRIFVHRLDEFGSRPVPGTENARSPFLSPDGRWLGFLQGGELKKLDLQGGSPVTLAPVPGPQGIRGADWTDQGQIYFGNADEERIYRVSVQGGAPEAVTPADTGWSAGLPQLLPGGRSLLFSRFRGTMGASEAEIDLLDLKSGEVRRLNGDQAGLYSAAGFLVSARQDGSLMAQRFDPRSLALSGEPIRIGEGIIVHAPDPDAEFAVSATGSVVYRRGSQAETDLQEYAIDGAPIAVHPAKRWSMQPSYSPDGRQIAFVEARDVNVSGVGGALFRDTRTDIWVLDLGSGIATQLSAGGRDWDPVWSADGRFVLWTRTDADTGVLMRRRADLSAGAEPFGPGVSGVLGMPARSPGPIPFTHVSHGKIDGLWLVGQDGSDPHPWRATYRGERSPALSPSGRWIAYESGQSGRSEVYVEPFPTGGPVTQVSKAGGQVPVWATDERLLFLTPATALMGVDLDLTGERPRPTGYRELVVAVAQNSRLGAHAMSVSSDGRRMVLLRQSGAPEVLLEVNRLRHLAGEGTK